jgi:YVTN family beta-propeller protein
MPAKTASQIRLPAVYRRARLLAFLVGALLAVLPAASAAAARSVYVPGAKGVSVIDTATNQRKAVGAGTEITLGAKLRGIAITPDGRFAYVADAASNGVSVIDTRTNEVVPVGGGDAIGVGEQPGGIAMTPDGRFVYVADKGSGGVSVIETATNEVKPVAGGTEIKVGKDPFAIAITPDGRFAYVANSESNGVSVIDTATNEVRTVGGLAEVPVATDPLAIAITPDGRFAYVVGGGGGITVIDTATNAVQPVGTGKEIVLGQELEGVAIAPDGRLAYVSLATADSVAVIDTASNEVKPVPGGMAIPVGAGPNAIAITPDGRFAYVADAASDGVSVIDTRTNEVVTVGEKKEIAVGKAPEGIAVTPDQPPVASFTTSRARPGVPSMLDASASTDPDSAISTYAWSFGDGHSETLGTPRALHAFPRPGTYTVSLQASDVEGCSTPDTSLFTGQTALCRGDQSARASTKVLVAYPGVRIRCPRNARPRGCSFELRAILRKPRRGRRPKAESLAARARVRPGRSAVVSLQPTKKFAARLAVARRVLVEETVSARGSRRTRFLRLKIVQ